MPFEEFETPPTPLEEEEKIEAIEEFDHEMAWKFREEMKDTVPASQMLESLAGLDSEEAWKMREELKEKGSREAFAKSLAGLDSEKSWEVREKLKEKTPLDLSRSLIGLDTEKAWQLREEEKKKIEELWQEEREEVLAKRTPEERNEGERRLELGLYLLSSSLAESLTGLDSEKAWEWREKLKGKMPIGVAKREHLRLPLVESVAGLDSEKAWRLREEVINEIESLKQMLSAKKMEAESPVAPIEFEGGILIPIIDKYKLKSECSAIEATINAFSSSLAKSLTGLDSERAWDLREKLLKDVPTDVAESLTGVDSERAWTLREELKRIAPGSVAKSLAGLNSERAWKLRNELKEKKTPEVVLGLESNCLLEAIKLARKEKR